MGALLTSSTPFASLCGASGDPSANLRDRTAPRASSGNGHQQAPQAEDDGNEPHQPTEEVVCAQPHPMPRTSISVKVNTELNNFTEPGLYGDETLSGGCRVPHSVRAPPTPGRELRRGVSSFAATNVGSAR